MEKIFKPKTKKSKFVLTFISAVLFNFLISGTISLGSLAVYFLSYIRGVTSWIDMNYGNLLMNIQIAAIGIFSPLSGICENTFGSKMTLFLGTTIIEISLFCLYIQRNLFLLYLFAITAGIGCGTTSYIGLKNACMYYEKHKGLITSVLLGTTVGGGGIFNVLGEKVIINPNNVPTGYIYEKDKNKFYPIEVAQNIKKFIFMLMIVTPIFSIISILFFIKYNESFEITSEDSNESTVKEDKAVANAQEKNKKDLKILLHTLKTFRFWRILFIYAAMPLLTSLITSIYRVYVTELGVDQKVISVLLPIAVVIIAITSPIYATTVDKFGFKKIIKFVALIQTFVSVYFVFFIGSKNGFIVGLICQLSISGSYKPSINQHIMNVYGLEHFLLIGGFFQLFNELSNFCVGLTSIFISKYYKGLKELIMPYRIFAVVSSVFAILGFVITFFENDEKVNFKEIDDNDYLKFKNNIFYLENKNQDTVENI